MDNESKTGDKTWPLYKKELLKIGNPASSTGICTLWTEKEKVLEKISPDNYLISAQCYNAYEGINIILRNCLANKKLRRIVVCGADLTGSGEALIALKEKGIDSEKRIIGFPNSKIEIEIPLDSIERFRKNIDIIDKRDVVDFSELNDFLANLPNLESWGEREIFKEHSLNEPKHYPSEKTGFVIRGKKVGEVWLKIIDTILKFGYKKKSQYSDEQLEIIGLISIITDENSNDINWEDYFQFSKKHFEDYLLHLTSAKLKENVNYTYGSRLRNFNGINQIDSMVEQLKKAMFSRRAVAVTWDVEKDHDNFHSPCLDLIQVLVQEKLHLTAYFRSNDMFGAWPENALALRSVQYEICQKLGVQPGDLIIISNSAHIYSLNWGDAKKILGKNPPKYDSELDVRGNILIEVVGKKIKLTQLDSEGKRIQEFYSESAAEACKKIIENQMISQISHALDIGAELEKAEIALREGRKYVQDKGLEE